MRVACSVFPCRNTVTLWSGITRLPLRGQYRHCSSIAAVRTDFPFHPFTDRWQGTLYQLLRDTAEAGRQVGIPTCWKDTAGNAGGV